MIQRPWLDVLAFGFFWLVIVLGLFRRKLLGLNRLAGWHVAADVHRWSPVGRFFGWIFLVLMAAVTIEAIVRALRTF